MNRREEYLEKMTRDTIEGTNTLPNGCTLYWKTNDQGCREYYSDECGAVIRVWDTTIIDDGTLLAALTQEKLLSRADYHLKEENKNKTDNSGHGDNNPQ